MATVTDINLGLADDDGQGEPLRTGGQKINDNITALNTELVALLTTIGVASGDTDLGMFAGTIINDNVDNVTALGLLEAAVEANRVLSAGYTAAPAPFRYPAPGDTNEVAISHLHAYLLTLGDSVRLAGTFDGSTAPTAGTAPDGTVQRGDSYRATGAGSFGSTVGTHDVEAGDRIIALADGPAGDADWLFESNTPEQWDVEEITADPGPAVVRTRYLATYGAAGVFTLPALSGVRVGDVMTLRNVDGFPVTVTPAAGERLNGLVDGTYLLDSVRQVVEIEKIAADQWSVGLDQVADPVRDELVSSHAGQGQTFTIPDQASLLAAGYEFVEFDLEAQTSSGQQYVFHHRREVAQGLANLQLWGSDGATSLRGSFNAAGTVCTLAYSGSFTIAGNHKVYGVRKQINAIRTEDAAVVLYTGTTGGGATHNETIPTTHAGKTLVSVDASQEYGTGSYSKGQQDSTNALYVNFNPVSGSVSFANRVGLFAAARGFRILATYI